MKFSCNNRNLQKHTPGFPQTGVFSVFFSGKNNFIYKYAGKR